MEPESILERIRQAQIVDAAELLKYWDSSDLETRGVIFACLTERGVLRYVQPEIDLARRNRFICCYLRDCIVQNPTDADWAHSDFEAGWALASWFQSLLASGSPDSKTCLAEIESMVRGVFLGGTERQRNVVINAFLEHVFESPRARKWFASWKDAGDLDSAYRDAVAWVELDG